MLRSATSYVMPDVIFSYYLFILVKVQNAVASGKTWLACTDEQHRWNAGTSKNLKPKRVSQINFRHHRADDAFEYNSRAVAPSLPNTQNYLSHKDFKDSVENAPTKPLFLLKNTLLGKCYAAIPLTPNANDNTSATSAILQPHQQHTDTLNCEKCRAFYKMYIEVDDTKAAMLEEETREQSSSELWHSTRKIRITASSAKRVPVHSTTNSDKFIREHVSHISWKCCHKLWERTRACRL